MSRLRWFLPLVLIMSGVVAPPAGAAPQPAKPYDFNGDGYADLATGVPGESIGSISQAGLVQVVYGSSSGLRSTGAQAWSLASPGVAGSPVANERFGEAVSSGDLDRDGFADLAVLMQRRIAVLYGSAQGLSGRSQLVDASVPWIKEVGKDAALETAAVGDFDGDRFSDLAVTSANPHMVLVLRGSGAGLKPAPLTFGKKAPGRDPDEYDFGGGGLAAGDLNGDGLDDLVVGTPADWDMQYGVGGFYFVPGSRAGLQPAKRRFVSQRARGLRPKRAVVSEAFGYALAVADFDRDGFGDVAVGDPAGTNDGSACDTVTCAGAVFVLPGTANGPTTRGRRQFALSQQPADDVWYGDYAPSNFFGGGLAAGDLNRDGRPDLAIAAQFDRYGQTGQLGHVDGDAGTGRVYVLYSTKQGLSASGHQVWSQRSPGVKGIGKDGEGFGSGGLQILDCGNGRTADLLVHSPRDRSKRGTVSVLYGSTGGVTTRGDQLWHQDRPGIPGRGERQDGFGSAR